MSAQVTLTLPDKVYERVRDFAQTRKQEIAAAITNLLEDSLPVSESQKLTNADQSEEFEALDRKEEAYIKLHAQLKKSHFGRYVAIYQGKLISFRFSDFPFSQLLFPDCLCLLLFSKCLFHLSPCQMLFSKAQQSD